MLSVIIPTYKDPYLQKTIDSLIANAKGKIEIIPVLDGYSPPEPLKPNPKVKVVTLPVNSGMRAAINAGLAKAHGKFIMKCDAHCIFAPGFDKILSKNCKENWLLIPRRYSLDEVNWKKDDNGHVFDYHYFAFPQESSYGCGLFVVPWIKKDRENNNKEIDNTMSFQGSCWFANRKYFMQHVGLLDDRTETYGTFAGDQQEIGLKYWLGGGEVKIIKTTWYAHLSKRNHHYNSGLYDRSYKKSAGTVAGHTWTAKHWMGNAEPNMIHPFSWLIEKFWPVPGWPEDRKLWIFPK